MFMERGRRAATQDIALGQDVPIATIGDVASLSIAAGRAKVPWAGRRGSLVGDLPRLVWVRGLATGPGSGGERLGFGSSPTRWMRNGGHQVQDIAQKRRRRR